MLGTIFLTYYLLFITVIYKDIYNTLIIRANLFDINSQNNNIVVKIFNYFTNIQSAENWIKYYYNNINYLFIKINKFTGFSETIRQLSSFINIYKNDNKNKDEIFFNWFAGIIDGDGNFDVRKDSKGNLVLKAIRIKLHNRDIRILTRIQNYLHFGRIRSDKHKPHSIYIISTKKEMEYLINKLNGLIRLKVPGFKKSCVYFNINYIEANYIISENDPYFSGLIDTDGSIVFNYTRNNIECNLEFKYNEYTSKLNLDNVIPYYKPYILIREHNKKNYKSIAFKYQNVKEMIYLYNFFMLNRLYCDFKFYRVSKIKQFIELREFKTYPKNSPEFKIYSNFLLDWIQYKNPLWTKVKFIDKIR